MAKTKKQFDFASAENVASVQEKASENVKSESKKKKTKPSQDYIRLDLRPTDKEDLKAYVSKRSGEVSAERGENVSITRYIQELIIKDMDIKKTKPTRKERIITMLDKFDDKELAALEMLISRAVR